MKNRNLYFKEFRLYLLKNDKSESSIKTYTINVNLFIEWFENETKEIFIPENITELDIIDWRNHLQENINQNENTINLKLASLKNYFEFLEAEKIIDQNPSLKVKRIKSVLNSTSKSFSDTDFRKIRRHILKSGNLQHWCMWNIFVNCGVRNSELTNIKLEDIELSERKGKLRVRGKGNKIRYVPLNNMVRDSINDWLKIRSNMNINYTNIFISERKAPYTRNGIWKIFNNYFTELRLEKRYSVHSCRHYFCRSLLKSGVDLSIVAALAGHSSGFITSQIYTLPLTDELEDAINKL